MANVVAARSAYVAARQRVEETRLALGEAIRDARAQGVQQEQIAKELGLTREQVRRYQAEFERKAIPRS
jgi:predicted transposase YdaD